MIHAEHAVPGAASRAVAVGDIERMLAEPGVLWVDLQDPTEEETKILSHVFKFHPLAIEDCVSEANHAKVDDYRDYVYLVAHALKPAAKDGKLGVEEVDCFLGKRYVVTYHKDAVRAIDDTRRRCGEIPGAARSADMIVHEVMDRMVDTFVRHIEELDLRVDELEHRLFRRAHLVPRSVINDIFALKKEVLQIKRLVNPLREVMTRFSRGEFAVVGDEAKPHFRDVYDHVYRVADLVESFRDVVTSALETYLTVVANRTNEVMKVLTIFSVILMTASLVAGIYGMNFTVLPGKDWAAGFWASLGLMGLLAGVTLLLFRKRKWI